MKCIKILALVTLPFLLISWLWSQDLTAAAKKEKERRDAAKAKKVTVITNSDLQAVKKKAAVAGETAEPATEGETEGAAPESGALPTAAPVEPAVDPGAGPDPMPMGAGGVSATQAEDAQKALLEGNYLKAKEYADLLETRVNGLWQTFYNMDDMTPKDQIQQQIADAFDKYQVARLDEEKAKEELDRYLATIKKD